MKLIDKDSVVAEIERLKSIQLSIFSKGESIGRCYDSLTCISVYNEILSFLDTLEMKGVDLEKEMDKEWNKCEPIDEGMGLEIASIEHEQFDNIATHFFELGLKAQHSSIGIPNIDDIFEEGGIEPNSKDAKIFKECYYMALEKLKVQKGK